jgi:hypothetical protein
MLLIVFVEEESAEAALRILLKRMIPDTWQVRLINFGSKDALLKKLTARLKGYAPDCAAGTTRIAVLVDRDMDACTALKSQLEEAARQAGLPTRSSAGAGAPFTVLNRIVVEELESWFLGDTEALRRAYPKLPTLQPKAKPFNNPDNGGTWEELERVLRRGGYHGSYAKIDGARRIATHMDPARNRSASFRAFRDGLTDLLASKAPPAPTAASSGDGRTRGQ